MIDTQFNIPQATSIAIGIGVESPNAIAAGATPCPLTDASWDGWMYHSVQLVRINTDANPWFRMALADPGIIDSRAMRRLEDNDLFLALELDTDSGMSINVAYMFFLRFLVSESSKS